MKHRKNLTILAAVLILSTSCKMSGSGSKKGDDYLGLSYGGVKIDSRRALSAAEIQIATRICNSTEIKKTLFKSYADKAVSLTFTGETMACGSTFLSSIVEHSVSIAIDVNYNNPEFFANGAMMNNVFKHIIFDDDFILAPICDAIRTNKEVLNYHENGSYKFALNFKSSNSQDVMEWITVTKSSPGQDEFISEANKAWINTNASSVEQRSVGLELSRQRVLHCAEGKEKYLKKDYVRFN